MGACSFTSVGRGKTAAEAFAEARQRAQYDHGHAGYTGTIAEKDRFVMIEPTPTERSEAFRRAGDLIDSQDPRIDDKWGPAGCIAIHSDGEYLFFGWASS